MRKLRGFTLIELLIVVAIIAILAAIAVPNFLEAQVRSKVSRVRSDQRSLATALEAYYVDNNQYPAMANNSNNTVDNAVGLGTGTGAAIGAGRSFRLKTNAGTVTGLSTLTTPIAYITSYFSDPFADTRGLTFRYYRDRAGWILGSWGPDTDQANGGDLRWNQGASVDPLPTAEDTIETVYDSRVSQPSTNLVVGRSTAAATATVHGAFTYDSTNGTVSQGDVWRVKE